MGPENLVQLAPSVRPGLLSYKRSRLLDRHGTTRPRLGLAHDNDGVVGAIFRCEAVRIQKFVQLVTRRFCLGLPAHAHVRRHELGSEHDVQARSLKYL